MSRKGKLIMGALEVGLSVTTYRPGKVTRYRFSRDSMGDYFEVGPKAIYTAIGIKDAESFLAGYRAALCYFNVESEM